MTTTTPTTFRHDALLYAGIEDFVDRTAAFVRAGLEADEAVAVAVIEPRAGALRKALATDAGHVTWIDMERVGRNPARIIPAWRQWTLEQGTRAFRGIGEPIWAGRSAAELVECRHHESLLNLAFDGVPWQLLCPYDVTSLDATVIDAVRHSHPRVLDADAEHRHPRPGADHYAATLSGPPLPDAPEHAEQLAFSAGELARVRAFVRSRLGDAPRAYVGHVLLTVTEIAGNSITHGGGHGTVALWDDGAALVCEIRDRGTIDDPLVGRHIPPPDVEGGRGLWIANQLCDLVQIRSTSAGTVVRLRLNPDRRPGG